MRAGKSWLWKTCRVSNKYGDRRSSVLFQNVDAKGNLELMFCHWLLHLIDLSDLAYCPPIVQLLVWLPTPRRVHKGHFFFVHSAFQTHAGTPVCIWVLPSLPCKHRCHTQKVHLQGLWRRTTWNQMKAAFAKLDARIYPWTRISFLPPPLWSPVTEGRHPRPPVQCNARAFCSCCVCQYFYIHHLSEPSKTKSSH